MTSHPKTTLVELNEYELKVLLNMSLKNARFNGDSRVLDLHNKLVQARRRFNLSAHKSKTL